MYKSSRGKLIVIQHVDSLETSYASVRSQKEASLVHMKMPRAHVKMTQAHVAKESAVYSFYSTEWETI